jgi:hypothetical protein
MKEIKKSNLEIQVPKGKAFAIETPAMMPKAHFLCACVGSRGSGKGVASYNFLKKLGNVDRLFYISPSIESNSVMLKGLGKMLSPEDCFSDVNDVSILSKIVKAVEQERDDYEEYWRKMEEWKNGKSKNSLFDFQNDSQFMQKPLTKPKHRWNGRIPFIVAYFDDILGSRIMTGNGAREVSRICMYHRHLGGFNNPDIPGAVGLSLLFNVQSFKTNIGGLPPALRSNLTVLIIFQTKNEKELKDLAESCKAEIEEEQFYDICFAAWEKPHDFLMIDMHPKQNHPSGMRRNFDTFLIP